MLFNKIMLFLFIGIAIHGLSPNYSEANRVITAPELSKKIELGQVVELYKTNAGIEGVLNENGEAVPFTVFLKPQETSEEFIKLAKEKGIKWGLKYDIENTNRLPQGMIIQIVFSGIYLGVLITMLISIVSLKRKVNTILSILKKDSAP